MGVDYYQCASCDTGFRDDSDYCAYCECGSCFCSKECGKLKNYGEWVEDEDDDSSGTHRINPNKDITCVICRKEKYTDYTLLEAVLKHFNITRAQAVNIWKGKK